MVEQVRMVFQPIFDGTMQIFAYEGLMRFTDTTIVKVINDCKSYSDFYHKNIKNTPGSITRR